MHMAKMSSVFAASLAALIAAAPAQAAIASLHFSGVFDDEEYYQIVQTPFDYTGYLRYDTATAPQSISATSATYLSTLGFGFPEFDFAVRPFRITITRSGADAYLSMRAPCQYPNSVCGADLQFVRLENYAGLALPDAVLLIGKTFQFTFTDIALDPWGEYTGDRNSNYGPGIFAAVPEPGSWAMLTLGFGSIGALIRQRRRVASV